MGHHVFNAQCINFSFNFAYPSSLPTATHVKSGLQHISDLVGDRVPAWNQVYVEFSNLEAFSTNSNIRDYGFINTNTKYLSELFQLLTTTKLEMTSYV